MKTKKTLYTTIYNNIGQVRIENAQKEIERLNRPPYKITQDNT